MIDFKTIQNSLFLKKITKSFTIYTGATFINLAIPFLLLPVLTRFLTPSDYGIWATFMAMSGIIVVLIPLGSMSAVARRYFDREKEDFDFSQYTFNAIVINFVIFLILLGILFSSKSFISQKLHIPSNWLLLLPVIGLCAAIYRIPAKLFVYKQRPWPYAALQLCNTFMEVILSLFFVVVVGLNWRGRALGMTVNRILFLSIGIFLLFRTKLLHFSINYKYIKDILRFGVPVVFHSLGFTIVAATDRFFLNRLVGLSATGLYSVGYSVAAIIGFFVGAFSLAWRPVLYEKLDQATDRLKTKLVKSTYLCFILILPLTILVILGGPIFLKFFVGKEFYGASRFIFWIALGYAIHGMYIMMAGYIFYKKKTYLLAMIGVIIVTCNIVFNYILIKLNGAIGAAQATFLTFLIRFILVWYFSNKVYPMPWFSFTKLLKAQTN